TTVFFGVGLYGGAFQAGVGLLIVVALARSGLDLVNANAVKVVVILVLTAIAVPVFVIRGQVDWGFAVVLSGGFALGGWLGARIAVRGGDRVIRPVLIVAVTALAGRMIGLY
ncbi:MAG: sulfite exporter TauE/SafE family protein, partial [Actinomycetota bacterium]|nr:sulfite exporter TauE/SafE family protein [Actinomycetota bacterium]